MEPSTHPTEGCDNARANGSAVALGVTFGACLGAVALAVTQNAVWMGLLTAMGIIVGAVFQANQGNRSCTSDPDAPEATEPREDPRG